MEKMNSLQDFIKSIPKDANSSIEKARYLYLELGKRSFYDTAYRYFMFGEEDDLFEYIEKPYQNPNVIICTTLAKQYSRLLNMARVRNRIDMLGNPSLPHYFVKFFDENGIEHTTDLTNDLKNIQFNCKTSYFGRSTIPPEILREKDIKLGYISKERSYSDDYWYIVKDVLKGNKKLTEKQKLEIALKNLQRFGDISKPRGC